MADAIISELENQGLVLLSRIIYRTNELVRLLDSGSVKFMMAPTDQVLTKLVETYGKQIINTANFIEILKNHLATEFSKTKREIRSINGQPIYLDRQAMANRKPGVAFMVGGVAIVPINNILITASQRQLLTVNRSAGPFDMINGSIFRAWVQTSGIEGQDLLALCVSNPKINELCNSADASGRTIFHDMLKARFGIQYNGNQNARDRYFRMLKPTSFYVEKPTGILRGLATEMIRIGTDYKWIVPILNLTSFTSRVKSYLVADRQDHLFRITEPNHNIYDVGIAKPVRKISYHSVSDNGFRALVLFTDQTMRVYYVGLDPTWNQKSNEFDMNVYHDVVDVSEYFYLVAIAGGYSIRTVITPTHWDVQIVSITTPTLVIHKDSIFIKYQPDVNHTGFTNDDIGVILDHQLVGNGNIVDMTCIRKLGTIFVIALDSNGDLFMKAGTREEVMAGPFQRVDIPRVSKFKVTPTMLGINVIAVVDDLGYYDMEFNMSEIGQLARIKSDFIEVPGLVDMPTPSIRLYEIAD